MRESDFLPEMLSHKNNLAQKERIALGARATHLQKELVGRAIGAYSQYIADIDYAALENGDAEQSVTALQVYLTLAKEIERADRMFNWRSDFASSIIPEFLYRAIHGVLVRKGLQPFFSRKNSVVEVTLSGSSGCDWSVRHKNQDLAVGLVNGQLEIEGQQKVFLVPVAVYEVKTNIDINKLNGLDFSAERLKRTFPNARYYLATETIDFSLQDNYASGSIDEVYVLRKQLRSVARRALQPLSPEVFAMLIQDAVELVERASIARGHVYERLKDGRLIHADI